MNPRRLGPCFHPFMSSKSSGQGTRGSLVDSRANKPFMLNALFGYKIPSSRQNYRSRRPFSALRVVSLLEAIRWSNPKRYIVWFLLFLNLSLSRILAGICHPQIVLYLSFIRSRLGFPLRLCTGFAVFWCADGKSLAGNRWFYVEERRSDVILGDFCKPYVVTVISRSVIEKRKIRWLMWRKTLYLRFWLLLLDE